MKHVLIERSSAGVFRSMKAVASGHGNGIRGTSRGQIRVQKSYILGGGRGRPFSMRDSFFEVANRVFFLISS